MSVNSGPRTRISDKGCATPRDGAVGVGAGLHATNATSAIKPKNIPLILGVNNFCLRILFVIGAATPRTIRGSSIGLRQGPLPLGRVEGCKSYVGRLSQR